MTLAQALLKIRQKDIPWLKDSCRTDPALTASGIRVSNAGHSGRSSPPLSAQEKDPGSPRVTCQSATDRFHRFYLWVFEMFLGSLISSSFYVTEAEGRGSEVHYYRKGVWNRLLKAAKEQMGCHFMRICADQTDPRAGPQIGDKGASSSVHVHVRVAKPSSASAVRSRGTLDLQGAPCVRFVPKKTSLRPITNLKSRPRAALRTKNSRYCSAPLCSILTVTAVLCCAVLCCAVCAVIHGYLQ